jgi:hypothetical protein
MERAGRAAFAMARAAPVADGFVERARGKEMPDAARAGMTSARRGAVAFGSRAPPPSLGASGAPAQQYAAAVRGIAGIARIAMAAGARARAAMGWRKRQICRDNAQDSAQGLTIPQSNQSTN